MSVRRKSTSELPAQTGGGAEVLLRYFCTKGTEVKRLSTFFDTFFSRLKPQYFAGYEVYLIDKTGTVVPLWSVAKRGDNGAGTASRAAFRPGVEILYSCP